MPPQASRVRLVNPALKGNGVYKKTKKETRPQFHADAAGRYIFFIGQLFPTFPNVPNNVWLNYCCCMTREFWEFKINLGNVFVNGISMRVQNLERKGSMCSEIVLMSFLFETRESKKKY